MQLTLVEVPPPVIPDTIDLRCCSAQEMIDDLTRAGTKASLVVADPPWYYSNSNNPAHVEGGGKYSDMRDDEVVSILNSAYDIVDTGRLAVWCTWPKLDNYYQAKHKSEWRWRYVSGGSWSKDGPTVMGFHWRGASELVCVYVKGTNLTSYGNRAVNNHRGHKAAHSQKPAEWMANWLLAWTDPGDLVVDIFAGCANLAVACAWTGRRYIGCELDGVRHRTAIDNVAMRINEPPKTYASTLGL